MVTRSKAPVTEVPNFPFEPGPLAAPPCDYAARRPGCPAGRVPLHRGYEAVLLVTFADVLAALGDTRLTHDLTAPRSPRLTHGRSFRDDQYRSFPRHGGVDVRHTAIP
jgi:hypothetical protein